MFQNSIFQVNDALGRIIYLYYYNMKLQTVTANANPVMKIF